MNSQARLVAAAKGHDTQDLLNHIAWTEVVKPALLKHRTDLSNLLIQNVLGSPTPQALSKEQLAGAMYGIDFVVGILEKILREGQKAVADLEASGFHLTQ